VAVEVVVVLLVVVGSLAGVSLAAGVEVVPVVVVGVVVGVVLVGVVVVVLGVVVVGVVVVVLGVVVVVGVVVGVVVVVVGLGSAVPAAGASSGRASPIPKPRGSSQLRMTRLTARLQSAGREAVSAGPEGGFLFAKTRSECGQESATRSVPEPLFRGSPVTVKNVADM
jgi:hypothetical protein